MQHSIPYTGARSWKAFGAMPVEAPENYITQTAQGFWVIGNTEIDRALDRIGDGSGSGATGQAAAFIGQRATVVLLSDGTPGWSVEKVGQWEDLPMDIRVWFAQFGITELEVFSRYSVSEDRKVLNDLYRADDYSLGQEFRGGLLHTLYLAPSVYLQQGGRLVTIDGRLVPMFWRTCKITTQEPPRMNVFTARFVGGADVTTFNIYGSRTVTDVSLHQVDNIVYPDEINPPFAILSPQGNVTRQGEPAKSHMYEGDSYAQLFALFGSELDDGRNHVAGVVSGNPQSSTPDSKIRYCAAVAVRTGEITVASDQTVIAIAEADGFDTTAQPAMNESRVYGMDLLYNPPQDSPHTLSAVASQCIVQDGPVYPVRWVTAPGYTDIIDDIIVKDPIAAAEAYLIDAGFTKNQYGDFEGYNGTQVIIAQNGPLIVSGRTYYAGYWLEATLTGTMRVARRMTTQVAINWVRPKSSRHIVFTLNGTKGKAFRLTIGNLVFQSFASGVSTNQFTVTLADLGYDGVDTGNIVLDVTVEPILNSAYDVTGIFQDMELLLSIT